MRYKGQEYVTLVLLAAVIYFYISWKNRSILVPNVYTVKDKKMIRVCRRDDLYAYSAVAKPSADWTKYISIIITSWCKRTKTQFNCFLDPLNKTVQTVKATSKEIPSIYRAKLVACQYECKLENTFQQIKDYVSEVGLSPLNDIQADTCPQITKVVYPTRHAGKMAICSKMAYGTKKAIHLIEWFEYNRLMGVDRIITMVQLINRDAFQVLKYYKEKGVLDMDFFPSPLPGESTTANANCSIKDRTECFKNFSNDELKDIPWNFFRRPTPKGEQDQNLAIAHCQQKLQGYDFVANIDFDEFIVQSNLANVKEYFKDTLLPKYSQASGFTLNESYFMKNWGISGDGFLQMTQYIKTVNPRYVNYKNVYIPSRTERSTTHDFYSKPGFKRIYLRNHHVVINHYRLCPKVAYWKNCMSMARYEDITMLQIRKEMEQRVLKVKREIGLI